MSKYLPIKFYPKSDQNDPVLNYFKSRIHSQDNDVFLITAGARGTTKSGSSISLGLQSDVSTTGYTRFYLQPKYLPRGFSLGPGEYMPRVVFLPSQIMDMLKHFQSYPRGTALLWDEVGVHGDARDFAMKKNKFLKRTFQTIRSLNWFLMLTAVTMKDFDVAFERTAGFYMKALGKVNLQTSHGLKPYGNMKFYEINVNPTTAKRYYPHINYENDSGKIRQLSGSYYVRKPPACFENPYKRYKEFFQQNLYGAYASEMDSIEQFQIDESSETSLVSQAIQWIEKHPWDFFDRTKNRFSVVAIKFCKDFSVGSDANAKQIADLMQFKYNKGFFKTKLDYPITT